MFSEPASGDSFLSKAVMLQPPKTASPTGGQSVSIPEVMGHTTFSRHFIKLSESKKGEGGILFCFIVYVSVREYIVHPKGEIIRWAYRMWSACLTL